MKKEHRGDAGCVIKPPSSMHSSVVQGHRIPNGLLGAMTQDKELGRLKLSIESKRRD